MNETELMFHPRHGAQLARRTAYVPPSGRAYVPYDYSDEIVIAVNAALATERPLLLYGNPGSGKSTLARDIAVALGADRDFEEKVITSRTKATDLLWTFDAVRRLSDAQAQRALEPQAYVGKGVLWKAFEGAPSDRAVVLLDEIDKADPDVPNDLLVPLGENRFTVTDADAPLEVVRQRPILVLITTNGERELPPAFLRRCVSLHLADPSADAARLDRIARSHLAALFRDKQRPAPPYDGALVRAIVERIDELATTSTRRPGTAEILDAFRASIELGIDSESADWKLLTQVLLLKEPRA